MREKYHAHGYRSNKPKKYIFVGLYLSLAAHFLDSAICRPNQLRGEGKFLKNIRLRLLVLVFTWVGFALLALQPKGWAEPNGQTEPKYSNLRHRDTPEGLYITNYGDPGRGIRIAGTDEASIRAARLAQGNLNLFDLKSGAQVSEANVKAKDRPLLVVVGMPLFGKETSETLELIRSLVGSQKKGFTQWFKDFFYLDKSNPSPDVKAFGRPGGKWKVLEHLVYPSILPRDMTPVTKDVIRHGMHSVLISSSIGLTIQLSVQIGERGSITKALAVVIPAALINMAQSAWTSLPRNWWQNYFKRSDEIAAPVVETFVPRSKVTDRISRVIGSVAQQIWMTVFFTFNVFVAGQGDLGASLKFLSLDGLKTVFEKKWPSMIVNIFWRTPAENALADFSEMETNLGRGKEADVEGAKIRKILTIVATNLWVYSTLTSMNWEYLGARWNLGHLGMAIIGSFGIYAWVKPRIIRYLTKTGRCAEAIAKVK